MRKLGALLVLGAAALVAACGDDSQASTSGGSGTGSGGSGSGGAAPEGWIAGRCGVCFQGQCDAEVAACDADPGCASSYTCLKACAADPAEGPAAVACAEACTVPDSSTAQQAYAALQACRVTGDGYNGCADCRTDDGPVCEPLDPPTNCSTCLERECCETIGPYRLNAEAIALNDCLIGCPDSFPECILSCAELHPDGLADWGSNLGCVLTACLGGENCENPGTVTDPCVKCTADNCAASYRACQDDPQCVLYDACYSICLEPEVDEVCIEDCGAQYPGAVALHDTYLTCAVASCEEECSGDS